MAVQGVNGKSKKQRRATKSHHSSLRRLIADSSCGKDSEAIISFSVLVIAFSCCWAICLSTQGAFDGS